MVLTLEIVCNACGEPFKEVSRIRKNLDLYCCGELLAEISSFGTVFVYNSLCKYIEKEDGPNDTNCTCNKLKKDRSG